MPQVAYKYGVETHNLLKEAGADITFKTYNGMAHSVSACWLEMYTMYIGGRQRPGAFLGERGGGMLESVRICFRGVLPCW